MKSGGTRATSRKPLRSFGAALIGIAAMLALLAAAPAAQAALQWDDGVAATSTLQNCFSFEDEYGAGAYVGQYVDAADPPKAGEPFYVHVVFEALTEAFCEVGQSAEVDLVLPPGVSVSPGPGHPIRCLYSDDGGESEQPNPTCPTHTVTGTYGQMLPPSDGGGPWSLPVGRTFEVQVPLVSTRKLDVTGGSCQETLQEVALDSKRLPRRCPARDRRPVRSLALAPQAALRRSRLRRRRRGFSLGKLHLNRRRGTGALTVKVPAAGTVVLVGSKQVRGARRKVGAAGAVKLPLRPKGKAKRQLARRGRVQLTVRVRFAPKRRRLAPHQDAEADADREAPLMSPRSGSRTVSVAAVLVALLACAARPNRRAGHEGPPSAPPGRPLHASRSHLHRQRRIRAARPLRRRRRVLERHRDGPVQPRSPVLRRGERSASPGRRRRAAGRDQGVLLHWEASSSEEVLVATESGSVHQQCSTVAMPEAAGAPAPALRVGKAGVSVESLTALSVSPPRLHPAVPDEPLALRPPARPWLEPILIADSLDPSLPAAFAAQAARGRRQARLRPDRDLPGLLPRHQRRLPGRPADLMHPGSELGGTVKIEDECARGSASRRRPRKKPKRPRRNTRKKPPKKATTTRSTAPAGR